VPIETYKVDLRSIINILGGTNQTLKLFNRGKAISSTNNIKGSIQFPNAPIATGITMKKIIKRACEVRITLNTCLL
jgi:hypothetical protein